MTDVSIRDLRNHGGEIVPLQKRPLTAEALLERSRHLQPIDYEALRAELDEIINPSL